MTTEIFKTSISSEQPPEGLSIHLQSLWFDAKGNWEKAHEIIQDFEDNKACWIHAYLHRKEGDIWNADYWYRKANKSRPDYSLTEEWDRITSSLLQV